MIDLDEELARMEGMLERRERMALGVTCNEVIELITRLRQAEKDAARYRWLRDLPDGSCHEEIGNYPGDMWDAAIDEAMSVNQA